MSEIVGNGLRLAALASAADCERSAHKGVMNLVSVGPADSATGECCLDFPHASGHNPSLSDEPLTEPAELAEDRWV
jgi:hypothetical protein